jgi:thiol-disulfide isomerase/thioredoxin
MANDLSLTVWQWMKCLDIPASKTMLQQHLEQHPDYPSAFSITDTLEDLGIDNMAIQVEKENLIQIPFPFLAHVRNNSGDFKLINDRLLISNTSSDFYKQWSGVVIAAEKPETFSNSDNQEALKQERKQKYLWLGFLLTILIFSFIAIILSFELMYALLSLSSLAGIGIAALIVLEELGVNNELTQAFCSSGKNTDCNAVIQSNGGKLLKWLSWSDIGIIFFVGQWFILLASGLSNTTPATLSLLKLIAICSLPFTVFSVCYQWRIAKKWCTLCLSVIGLLVFQFIALLFLQKEWLMDLQWLSFSVAILVFTATATTWLLLKPLLIEKRDLQQELATQLRFKNNPDIFLSLLQQQRKIDTTRFSNELELATSGAPLQILVACNPYCGPCAKAHEVLHQLSERYSSQISLAVRFTITVASKEDKRTKAVEYLLQHAIVNNNSLYTRMLLHDWFTMMEYEKFIEHHPLTDKINVTEQLKEHDQWTANNDIDFTPTVFINGYEIPKQYAIEDLIVLVRGVLNKQERITSDNTPLLKSGIKDPVIATFTVATGINSLFAQTR